MSELYKGTGNIKDYEHSLDFLDRVFFSDDPDANGLNFITLLPKLYKKEYDHCAKNHIISLDGQWQAAVGLYIEGMDICGEKILCGGIGNVGVEKNCRGKGYMIDCLNLAKEKCVEDNVDFMILDGQRQRYGYFGYEPAGREYQYSLNKTNLRHTYKNYNSHITFHPVGENDTEFLDFIFELYNKSFKSKTLRKREKLFDTLVSWRQKPFVFIENGEYIGYAIFSKGIDNVMEIACVSEKSFVDILPLLLKISGKDDIKIKMPPECVEYNQFLCDICEWVDLNHCGLVNILNWKNMVYALLKFNSNYKKLCDGEKSFLIHGSKKNELFTIKIENGVVNTYDGGENYVELSHKEAMQMFLGLYSRKRNELSSAVSGWFPLDFMLFSSDIV